MPSGTPRTLRRWHIVDGTIIETLGARLRQQLPTPEAKLPKELRRLIVELARRERERDGSCHPPSKREPS
jgi:hypothetical protein